MAATRIPIYTRLPLNGHFTKDDNEKIDAATAERNLSLCQQIQEQLSNSDPSKKVFIIAGLFHIFDEKSAAQVRQALEKYRFAVIAPKDHFKRFNFTLPAGWKQF